MLDSAFGMRAVADKTIEINKSLFTIVPLSGIATRTLYNLRVENVKQVTTKHESQFLIYFGGDGVSIPSTTADSEKFRNMTIVSACAFEDGPCVN